MILNVSRRRSRQLIAMQAAKAPQFALYERERRELVKGGHAQPTPEDIARVARAEAKRARKAEKVRAELELKIARLAA